MIDTLRSLRIRFFLFNAAMLSPAALVAQSLGGVAVPCKGQIISRIEVSTRPPFEIRGSRFQRRLTRQLTELHATTNPEVIDRFLALRPGMACSELRRVESERILRAQPYLADATITAMLDDAGGVFLSVVTQDEISIVLGGGGSGSNPFVKLIRLGEQNFMGEAISVVGQWRYSEHFRDNFNAQITDYQFLGRPYQLSLQGARNELGGVWGVELSHPFLSDLQKVSWRTTAGSREEYRYFRGPDLGPARELPDRSFPAVGLQRSYGDVGGVVRLGPPGGQLVLLGGSASYEDEMPNSFPTMVGLGTTQRDTIGLLVDRYARHKSVRLNALAGFRHVSYIQATGFESLDGRQDMRKGVELATLLGRGYEALGSQDADLFASANLYVGTGTPLAFAAFEGTLEGRREYESNRWDGILGSSRFATYIKPAVRHTILTSFEWGGGWRQRIPFQLLLADRTGGPRGYARSSLGGGQRFVLRFEDRIFLGRLKSLASVGVAPFTDLAKVYAGDSPFGVTSGINASVGISILASVPPKSQRMWKLDVAFPLNRSHGAQFKVSLLNRDFTSVFWREPADVRHNRERSVPTSIFNWPN
ncbi:MAG: hypothetical protein ABIQ55_13740 [Gemmatimonadaceae bacterium]